MLKPISRELQSVTLDAVNAVIALVRDSEPSLGYVSRLDIPAFRVNEHGWPAVVGGSLTSGKQDQPINWNFLFGPQKGTYVNFDPTDVPELQRVIDLVLASPDLLRRISAFGARIDDPERRHLQQVTDVINVVTTIAARVDALGASESGDIEEIYLQFERSLLSDSLRGDLLFPIVLRKLDLENKLQLSESVSIEPLDELTQRVRAPGIYGGGGVNPYLVAAATHAIVLQNREFDNSDGPDARRIRMELSPQDTEEVEQVCQAVQVLSGVDVGYAQVLLRPIGWSNGWKHDLPPIEKVQTVRRYSGLLDDAGWNQAQPEVSADILAKLPVAYTRLTATNKRAKLAARRLFQTSLRELKDDVILDACIGIEALLGEQHDELVHRMGLRASVALSPVGWNPERAYDALKKVYAHRSKIVHGTEPARSTVTFGSDTKSYPTHWVAVVILRELLRAHLASDHPWDATSLDAELFKALEGLVKGEG